MVIEDGSSSHPLSSSLDDVSIRRWSATNMGLSLMAEPAYWLRFSSPVTVKFSAYGKRNAHHRGQPDNPERSRRYLQPTGFPKIRRTAQTPSLTRPESISEDLLPKKAG